MGAIVEHYASFGEERLFESLGNVPDATARRVLMARNGVLMARNSELEASYGPNRPICFKCGINGVPGKLVEYDRSKTFLCKGCNKPGMYAANANIGNCGCGTIWGRCPNGTRISYATKSVWKRLGQSRLRPPLVD